jgi:putative transposase
MPLGRPIPAVTIDAGMRAQLQTMTRSRSLPQALTQRAKIILLAADGLNNSAIAVQLGLSRPTVGKWRRRFLSQGLVGLYEEARPGAPRQLKINADTTRWGREDFSVAGLASPGRQRVPAEPGSG